jgi:hypothetical protein
MSDKDKLAMLAYACGLDMRHRHEQGNVDAMTWGPLPWLVRQVRPDGSFVGARAFMLLCGGTLSVPEYDESALVVTGQQDDDVELPMRSYETWHEAAWAVLTWEWKE